MSIPSREYIISINRSIISSSGGEFIEPDNLLFPGKLDWVLEAIQYPIFNTDLYPSILEKAAILSWQINQGHIFYDGNKRSSIFLLNIFLNSFGLDLKISDADYIDLSLRVARSRETQFSFEMYVDYLKTKLTTYRG